VNIDEINGLANVYIRKLSSTTGLALELEMLHDLLQEKITEGAIQTKLMTGVSSVSIQLYDRNSNSSHGN
jgi:hypothetical protein